MNSVYYFIAQLLMDLERARLKRKMASRQPTTCSRQRRLLNIPSPGCSSGPPGPLTASAARPACATV